MANPAIDTVTATVTAAAAGGSAAAAVLGDSLALRSTGSRIRLLNAWIDTDALGFVQITSPKLHDNTRGIRLRTTVHQPFPLLPYETMQDLFPVDALAVTIASAAGAGKIDNLCMLLYYDDLQGPSGRYLSVGDLEKRRAETVTVEFSLAPTAGNIYSTATAITGLSDLLKRGSDYVLVGYKVDTEATAITIRGADTGNLRIGMPCDPAGGFYTGSWFYDLSLYTNLALMPMFAANNSPGIFIELVSNDLLATVKGSLIFVRVQ